MIAGCLNHKQYVLQLERVAKRDVQALKKILEAKENSKVRNSFVFFLRRDRRANTEESQLKMHFTMVFFKWSVHDPGGRSQV